MIAGKCISPPKEQNASPFKLSDLQDKISPMKMPEEIPLELKKGDARKSVNPPQNKKHSEKNNPNSICAGLKFFIRKF